MNVLFQKFQESHDDNYETGNPRLRINDQALLVDNDELIGWDSITSSGDSISRCAEVADETQGESTGLKRQHKVHTMTH